MAEKKSRVICVGEVMVELSRGTEARYGLSFGGDTFNPRSISRAPASMSPT